jgi:hypothetical protein
MSLEGIHEAAGKMQTDDLDRDTTVIQGEELLQLNMTAKSKEITCEAQEGKLMIESAMPDSSHRYLYMSEMLDAALYTDGGKVSLRFNGNGDLDIMGVCVLFDSDKKKLSPVFAQMNRQMAVDILRRQSISGWDCGLRVQENTVFRPYLSAAIVSLRIKTAHLSGRMYWF